MPTDASPAVRHEYITLDRVIRFGRTPDCRSCSETGRHNGRCKARFDALVKTEKAAKIGKVPSTPADGSKPLEEPPADAIKDDVVPECPAPSDAGEDVVNPDDLLFSAGIPPASAAAGKILQIDDHFLE